jgi:hypothetical protein
MQKSSRGSGRGSRPVYLGLTAVDGAAHATYAVDDEHLINVPLSYGAHHLPLVRPGVTAAEIAARLDACKRFALPRPRVLDEMPRRGVTDAGA